MVVDSAVLMVYLSVEYLVVGWVVKKAGWSVDMKVVLTAGHLDGLKVSNLVVQWAVSTVAWKVGSLAGKMVDMLVGSMDPTSVVP